MNLNIKSFSVRLNLWPFGSQSKYIKNEIVQTFKIEMRKITNFPFYRDIYTKIELKDAITNEKKILDFVRHGCNRSDVEITKIGYYGNQFHTVYRVGTFSKACATNIISANDLFNNEFIKNHSIKSLLKLPIAKITNSFETARLKSKDKGLSISFIYKSSSSILDYLWILFVCIIWALIFTCVIFLFVGIIIIICVVINVIIQHI